MIGADMSGDLSLGANGIPQVTNLVVDALHRTDPDGVVLTAPQLALLDAVAPQALQQLVTTALSDATTVAFARTGGTYARTPEFPIPSSLSIFGLPSTGSFGQTNPLFGVESSQLVYRGAFGLR